MSTTILSLLTKYDKPTPRYTSYPTVPYWEAETLTLELWKQSVRDTFVNENGELCIYAHLPFCENLCTFCACNKRITKNHSVEDKYIQTVLKEWKLYREILRTQPTIREIHLGGGTPTFFSPENLTRLVSGLIDGCTIADGHEFSVEVHPNYTTRAHLDALRKVGFKRISLGVQDFDPKVQYMINRLQSYEKTKEVVDCARELGYDSINVDLVYGLPHQTVNHIEYTIDRINQLLPDRIAFYSYAHVPWKSKGQRRYSEVDLPAASDKLKMYSTGRALLLKQGYYAIGMDHFALTSDKLRLAAQAGKMHRNFMGYTTTQNKLIIGLGASSISDAWGAFAQNEKEVESYEEKIENEQLPIITGHKLNEEDIYLRKKILELICTNQTRIDEQKLEKSFYESIVAKMINFSNDGLVKFEDGLIEVTAQGGTFIRNICSALDARLWRKNNANAIFSKAI